MSEQDKTSLGEALEQRFFQHLELLGFVRDNRQQPSLICFRRRTDAAMQIIAVLSARRGCPGFFVQFTEAPLNGIEYGGRHLAPEDIYPGNFALVRGWLIPARGKRWFRLDQPLWRRLFLRPRDNPGRLVERLLELFPEVVAWWKDKVKREHLLILPPLPPRPVPDHAPVFGCPVKPSLLQKLFAHTHVWIAGLLGIAVGVDLTIAIQATDLPQMFALVFIGAICGFAVSWVFFKMLWHFRAWTNGGPFRKGDLVLVIAGTHAGRIAIVYEEWPSRGQVRVDLGEREWKEVKDVFTHVQLCKVKSAQPGGSKNPGPPAAMP